MSSMLRLPSFTAGKNGGGGDNRWWQLCIAGNAIERREKEAFHLPASVTQLKLLLRSKVTETRQNAFLGDH